MIRTKHAVAVILLACVAVSLTTCGNPAPIRRAGPPTLVGKPAPAFITVDDNGNEIDLSKHLGKDVIMLDFWASWCGPCMMAMPEVASIAHEYKDRGLVFYAVNEGEDPDSVKEFLAKMKLDVPVAMDFDGRIDHAFMGAGLPHTVLIGKDGRVQVDHRGYWQTFGIELHRQVDDLINGKNLADPK